MREQNSNHPILESITDQVLEVDYSDNHVRMVINDTLPWTGDEALFLYDWSDEDIITFHLEALERKVGDCMAVAASEAFQLRHPGTAPDDVLIVLRLRHMPISGAKAFLMLIQQRVRSEGMHFVYGYGGDLI